MKSFLEKRKLLLAAAVLLASAEAATAREEVAGAGREARVVVESSVEAGLAPTQEVADPTGRIRVMIDASWELLDAAQRPHPSGDAVFFAQQADPYPLATCELTLHTEPLPRRQTRESLNASTERLRRSSSVANEHNARGFTVETVETGAINGIAVLDVRVRGRFLVGIERRVLLQGARELQLYTLACAAHGEDAEAVAKAFTAASTLQVHE